jgi:hypothetical protein
MTGMAIISAETLLLETHAVGTAGAVGFSKIMASLTQMPWRWLYKIHMYPHVPHLALNSLIINACFSK